MMYSYVTSYGNRILHRWVDDEGKRHSEYVDFEPSLFVKTQKPDSTHRGIRGEYLKEIKFNSVEDATEFVSEHEQITNFEIHGNMNWWAQFINLNYRGEINWDISKLVIANIDIEVLINDPDNPNLNPVENPMLAVNRITAITIEVNGKYIVFGSKEYKGKHLKSKRVKHIYCECEEELLVKFLSFWERLEPDIVTGWNINNFDIPYLVGRIERKLGAKQTKRLAPTANKYIKNPVRVREYSNGEGSEVILYGISCMDYLDMYKKFTYKTRERYSLDHIAYVELNERKLDYSDYRNLDDLYERNYDQYIDYNIHDVELVKRLDEKLNLFMLCMSLVYTAHIRHEDVFSQVRMWDTFIYNTLLDENVVVPPKTEHIKSKKYEGAYVREPEIGMHNWVVSFDLNSLYPHLIMHYNISPEMLVEDAGVPPAKLNFGIDDLVNGVADTSFLKEHDLSMAANKVFFRRDKMGFLPKMMEVIYAQRKAVKKKMLEAEQDLELVKSILAERGV